MKFHKQLYRHDPENGVWGDCYRTAWACLLDLEPEDVPHFCEGFTDDGAATAKLDAWLRERGLCRYVVFRPNDYATF